MLAQSPEGLDKQAAAIVSRSMFSFQGRRVFHFASHLPIRESQIILTTVNQTTSIGEVLAVNEKEVEKSFTHWWSHSIHSENLQLQSRTHIFAIH